MIFGMDYKNYAQEFLRNLFCLRRVFVGFLFLKSPAGIPLIKKQRHRGICFFSFLKSPAGISSY
jgi:hypothetical protein